MKHGGTYWSVVLVAFFESSAKANRDWQDTIREEKELLDLQDVGGGDLGCDRGAKAVLGVPESQEGYVVSVYFEREADALRFASRLDPAPAAVAKVTTYCLD